MSSHFCRMEAQRDAAELALLKAEQVRMVHNLLVPDVIDNNQMV